MIQGEKHVTLISDGNYDVEPYTGKWSWILDHSLFMACAFYTAPVLIVAFMILVII